MAILSDKFYYQHINLDTVNTQVFTNLTSKVGDTNGRGLIVTLTENGLQKDTTGISLNLKWKHRSVVSQGLDNFDVVDLSKGVYKITYPTEMNRSGLVDAFVQIVDGTKIVGTRNMIISVESTVGDDSAIESSNSFTALAQALIDVSNLESTYAPRLLSAEQQLEQAYDKQEVDALVGNLSDATPLFAETTAGMTVVTRIYVNKADGYLYVHNGTAWVTTGVLYQATAVDPFLDNIITQANDNGVYESIDLTAYATQVGFYDLSTHTFNGGLAYLSYKIIPVTPGKKVKYSTSISAGTNSTDIAFLKADDTFISYVTRNPGLVTDKIITVPQLAAKIVLGFQSYTPVMSQLIAGFKNKGTITYNSFSSDVATILAYEPLGRLSEGVVAFVDDDGYNSVLTHTKPLAEARGIPITLSLWATSEVLTTPQNVINLQNSGWEVAQHYSITLKNHTEAQLISTFDAQKTSFTSKGILNVNNMVYPLNESSPLLRLVSRKYFKLCATGGEKLNGHRADLYNMSRVWIRTSASLAFFTNLIDQAIADKKALIFYWHSFELEGSPALLTLVGQVMDYAKTSGVKITTLQGIYDS